MQSRLTESNLFVQIPVTDEERNLAQELEKNYCYANGKEKNVKESAKILHKLGLIYKERSPDKIGLIQSATLLNAAITRKPDNVDEIKEDLSKFCNNLLEVARAQLKNADLIAHAAVVKSEIEEMRQKAIKELSNIKIIPNTATGVELLYQEEKKIKDVQMLQNKIAEEYKSIMSRLAHYCVGIMGDAPCNFTLAGMGSLARKEITPYSDFENIIILEEGVQNRHDYMQIREYFKWFAVIFQIILINLEETIIPSVAIPCLNDCTLPDGEERWSFFDAYTTRGVSFDGMMPHACKSPLGRQQKTKNKPWKTELIQPVRKMAEFVDKDMDFQNGYHLADILTKTCYVYGDCEVYDQFKALVKQKSENYDEEVKCELEKQIKEDLQNFNTQISLSNPKLGKKFNVKRVVYRSTTIFISGLGRLFRIDASSCHDILGKLGKMGVISSEFEHKLKYAVALACEIRLKVYMEKKSQDDWVAGDTSTEDETASLIHNVGKRSIFDYFQIAYCLQFDMCNYLRMNLFKFYFNPLSLIVATCYFLKVYDKAILAAKCIIETPMVKHEIKYTDTSDGNSFGQCFVEMQKEIDKLEHYKPQTKAHEQTPTHKSHDAAASFLAIGLCLYKINKYEEALDYYQKSLTIFRFITNDENTDSNVAECFNNIGVCLWRINRYNEALDYHKKSLKIRKGISVYEDSERDVATSLNNIGICLHDTNRYKDALEHFEKSLSIRKIISTDETSDIDVAEILNNIGNCLRRINKYKEAMDYHHKSLIIRKKTSEDETSDRHVAETFNSIGLCLHRTCRYKEALQYHEKSLAIRSAISVNKQCDREMAVSFNNIALSLRRISKYNEALEYHHKSLNIKTVISVNENTDRNIAATLNNMGLCLQDTNRYREAQRHYEKAMNIYKITSLDTKSDRWIGICFNNIGHCLQQIHKYNEAMVYLKKALNIRKKITVDETSDRSVATTLDKIGLCLHGMHKYEEALDHYEKSLDIRKRISVDENFNRDLADSYNNIGLCLHHMNRHDDALDYHQKSLTIRKTISVDENSDRCVAISYNMIGLCLHGKKKYNGAQEHYEKSLHIRKRISVDENLDKDMADSFNNIGLCLYDQDKYDEALDTYLKSMKIYEKIEEGEDNKSVTTVQKNIDKCRFKIECIL